MILGIGGSILCEVGTMKEIIIDGKSISVDSCIAESVNYINTELSKTFKSLGCCCGHGKYPKTIVVVELRTGEHFEYFTGTPIPRSRNLYYKDEEGIFHLPEVTDNSNKKN